MHVNDANSSGGTAVGAGDCRAEESLRAALDAGVTTYIMEVQLLERNLDAVKRDVEFTRSIVG